MTLTDRYELDLFEGCDPADVAGLMNGSSHDEEVPEGEVICREGDVPDCWWLVLDGMADVTSDGIYLGTVGPGESIGELALLDGQERAATVTAKSTVRLRKVGGEEFVSALEHSPGMAIAVARQLATRLRDTNRLVGGAARAARDVAPPQVAPITVSPDEPVHFNPFADGYFQDPTVQLNAIREQEAVHFVEMTGSYLVTRYDDVYALSRDKSVGIEVAHALPTPQIEAERAQLAADPTLGMSMLRRDGEDHTRLRRLVSKAFTPRAIDRWRERAGEVTDALLDKIDANGGGDVIAEFALPLPAQMISEMLGMSMSDLPTLRAWSHAMAKTLDPLCSDDERKASSEAAQAMQEYIEGVYDEKKAAPADDILSHLIAAEDEGQRLSKDEVVANVRLLYIAGHETTTNLIGNGLVELFRHPAQLDRVRTDPTLDTNLIEEVLRFNSPVQLTRRIPIADVAVGGTTIPAGSGVLLCAASANRDPRKWGIESADEFDVARPGANDQLSFGGGSHFCLGAALARLEGQIALPRIARRFPRLAPTYDEPSFEPRMVLHGVSDLPVSVGG